MVFILFFTNLWGSACCTFTFKFYIIDLQLKGGIMAKKLSLPAILVANDLLSGRIVMWSDKGFSENIHLATVAQNETQADELFERGVQALARLQIIDPELITVAVNPEGLAVPTHFREKIRVFGPTISYINEARYV
jgi:Protein of unknown function (DUF2849)